MIKAVIFDYFGVIRSDPFEMWLRGHQLKREGQYAELSHNQDTGIIDRDTFITELSASVGESREVTRQYFIEPSDIDRSLISIIRSLRRTHKTALLSNASSSLRESLARYAIDDCFDEIIVSGDVGLVKPDPKIFRFAAERLGLGPSDIIVVDDSPYNVEAANAIGMHGLIYTGLVNLLEKLNHLGVIN